jgi:ligand-binding sensor domain-containing protein
MKIQLLTASAVLLVSNLFAQTFTNYTTTDGLLNNNVICLDIAPSNTVWFGTQTGVSVFDGATWASHTTATDPGLVDNTIQAIFIASTGDVWVGTDFGASVYNGASWTTYTTTDGLGNNQIKCISEDANGDIWFGTNNGASEFTGSAWTSYGTAEGLPFGGVASLTMHASGDIWMGTGLSGIMIFNGSTFSPITSADGLIDDRIRAIVVDGSDNKWVATSEGVTVLDNSDMFSMNHTTMFTLPAPDTLNPVEDVKMDGQGNIWVGVYVDYLVTEGGVCAYDGNAWSEYHVSDGLVGPVVRMLDVDGNDDVWVATSTGVSKIHDPFLAVSELSGDEQFEIYPNPADDILNVHFSSLKTNNQIEIYNTAMQLVKVQTVAINDENAVVSVEELSSGIYFLKLNGQTKKLILK